MIEVKVWKIISTVYQTNRAEERLLIESYCSNSPAINLLRVFRYNSNGSRTEEEENGCVIFMDDYNEGSIVAN